jgi:hypothetical protein
MSHSTLDDRVAALEREVARLAQLLPGEQTPAQKDWRSSLGIFTNDPVIQEIIEEGRRIRQQDREQPSE